MPVPMPMNLHISIPHRRCVALAALLVALVASPAQAQVQSPATPEAQDFSAAERLLFMTDQLGKLKAPTELSYSFRKSGSLEEAFSDKVSLKLKPEADGSCCAVSGEFLSGSRRMMLPEVDNADANPVLLYFLEHDVRDMKRLTKGNENYYRKRIRMAVYNAASISDVKFKYKGKPVAGREVLISPYDDDPARSRFEKFARKSYAFYLSEDVPGGVYGVRTVMRGEAGASQPMLVEEMFLEGGEPPASPVER